MHISLAIFGLEFIQKEKPCKNEIQLDRVLQPTISLEDRSTDNNLTAQFDFSPWLHLK